MIVYLAGPIDMAAEDERRNLRTRAAAALRQASIAAFDPYLPYLFPRNDAEGVMRCNTAAIAACDGMLALLPPGVPTFGTPLEIKSARDTGKPIAVVGESRSMALDSLGVRCFGALDLAIQWLQEEVAAVAESGVIKWVGESGCAPVQGYEGDAGFDLIASEDTLIPYSGFADVPCGIKLELPPDVWAMLVGRSSTIRRRKLLVAQAIIDQGYRGDIFAGVWNLGDKNQMVERGDRIAQLIPFSLTASGLSWQRVASLAPSPRGSNGFGSTGG